MQVMLKQTGFPYDGFGRQNGPDDVEKNGSRMNF
jgi:hypothetical protein